MTTNPANARKDEKRNVHTKTVKKSPEKNMSEIDEHILKRFDIKKRLGKGAYGIVWKAMDKKTKDVVAIKKIFDAFCNQTDAQRTFREIIFLQSFRNHPNIVKLHSIHRALNNRDIYLGFEYMETDLHNVIKRGNILKDIHKRYIMYQMLKATKYIHSGNVIHRDQKPSNVLIDSACRVKLADFGLARSVSSLYSGGEGGADPCLTDYVATRWYRAPEILIASKNYTKGIDMWSLGCILGEMLTGKPLFPGSSTVNQIERIMSVLPRPTSEDIASVCSGYGSSLIKEQASNSNASLSSLLSAAPRDAADLVKQLLVFNPTKRLSAEQALNHEYVSKFHREKDEVTLASDVLLPLRDDKQLSVDDYRNKLYSIMAKGFQNTNGLTRKSFSGKNHTLISTSKTSKSFQEITENTYTKSKHMSASAGVKTRTKMPNPERPLKEYRSDQAINKPVKVTKSFETRNIASVCSGYGSSLIKEQASNSNASLSSLLSAAPRDAADLVKQLLVFNPTKRLSAEQALNHEYVSKFHREKDEVTLASDVLLPLRDDKQLSVDDYRNKLYSIMAKGFQNTNGLTRKSFSGKNHTLISTSKTSKSFQEITENTYTKSKHMSASAGVKTRTKMPNPERPLKEYRSDQAINKPVKVTKSFETRSQEWLFNNSHGDYFPSGPSRESVYNSGKKLLQQRRNSTSFSTLGISDAVGFGKNQKHGVITATALMDLRTSIR